MVAMLGAVGAKLGQWAMESPAAIGIRIPGARGIPFAPTREQLIERVRGEPDLFFQAVIGLQASTLMAAYFELEASDEMHALEQAERRYSTRVCPTVVAAGLYRETLPGLCVTGGLGYVGSQLSIGECGSRHRDRCLTILRNSDWLVPEWAAQSQLGFSCLQETLMWGSPREPKINPIREVNELLNLAARSYPELVKIVGTPGSEEQEAPFWLLHPEQFELEGEGGSEQMVIGAAACEYAPSIWDALSVLNPASSKFRINCPALGVKVNGVSLVEHAMNWTLQLTEKLWDAIEW